MEHSPKLTGGKVMMKHANMDLVGVGLYTPAEAGHLIQVAPAKITRWLRGHIVKGQRYEPLWSAEVDLGEEGLFLSFRDLMEVRVAAAFIAQGLSPQKVRRAISLATEIIGTARPLSTTWFKTDGRSVFLQIAKDDGETQLIDLFKRQYAFREIISRSLKDLEFTAEGTPARWWPLGRRSAVLVDPDRSFGRPIEQDTGIPADILAEAVRTAGSVEAAARIWEVPAKSVRRAVAFEEAMEMRAAA